MTYLTIQLTDEQNEELRREMYCPECGEPRIYGWAEGGSAGNGASFGSGAWQSECRNGHKWNGTQSFSPWGSAMPRADFRHHPPASRLTTGPDK